MRVLVCGGRNYRDAHWLYESLSSLHKREPFSCVIEGNATGADRMAGYWARRNKIDNFKFPADWKMYGRLAGHIRNQQMLDEGKPDLVIAFPGGRGTADMVTRAETEGVRVLKMTKAAGEPKQPVSSRLHAEKERP